MGVLGAIEELTAKHLPGRHPQSRHAGERGAGRGTSSAAGGDVEDNAMFDYQSEGIEEPGGEGVSKVKHNTVTQLAEDSGLEYDRANALVAAWADTSNDSNPESMGMQQAVSEEFGVELSDYQKDRLDVLLNAENAWNQYGHSLPPDERKQRHAAAVRDGKKLTRAMYDRTQKELAEAGIKEVTVHRGITRMSDDARGISVGDKLSVRGNAMESWSVANGIASQYATPQTPEEVGAVVSASFPASRILSTPRTGFGSLGESEVVILGSEPGRLDEALVSEVIGWGSGL